MIKTLLIANRGEIAVRIIRTCREMGIATVAVYSTADAESLHVKMADRAICIGPHPTAQSYLNSTNIITAALVTHCDAIHPGFGFLSENADFAREVRAAGLIFIGPDPETIAMLGDKVAARETAEAASLPLIPGSTGSVKDQATALATAERIGFPVIIKAAAGGGGRGMRIVEKAEDLAETLTIAAGEAKAFFSDDTLYMEKYLRSPRHVEVQILADSHGNVIHLGERDCSVQKNHQKLVEESPSTAVRPHLRDRMGKDAVRLFKRLKYVGAGTVEFLVSDGHHYFMEVNARVQVEHPVTETISGVDIIREQILIASGKSLNVSQRALDLTGYALECRINALTPGKVTKFIPPLGPWVRTDTFLYPGYTVSPFYDSMIAKVIVHGPDRATGIDIMLRALKEIEIEGIRTNIDEQIAIISSRIFRSGEFGTDVYGILFPKPQKDGAGH